MSQRLMNASGSSAGGKRRRLVKSHYIEKPQPIVLNESLVDFINKKPRTLYNLIRERMQMQEVKNDAVKSKNYAKFIERFVIPSLHKTDFKDLPGRMDDVLFFSQFGGENLGPLLELIPDLHNAILPESPMYPKDSLAFQMTKSRVLSPSPPPPAIPTITTKKLLKRPAPPSPLSKSSQPFSSSNPTQIVDKFPPNIKEGRSKKVHDPRPLKKAKTSSVPSSKTPSKRPSSTKRPSNLSKESTPPPKPIQIVQLPTPPPSPQPSRTNALIPFHPKPYSPLNLANFPSAPAHISPPKDPETPKSRRPSSESGPDEAEKRSTLEHTFRRRKAGEKPKVLLPQNAPEPEHISSSSSSSSESHRGTPQQVAGQASPYIDVVGDSDDEAEGVENAPAGDQVPEDAGEHQVAQKDAEPTLSEELERDAQEVPPYNQTLPMLNPLPTPQANPPQENPSLTIQTKSTQVPEDAEPETSHQLEAQDAEGASQG